MPNITIPLNSELITVIGGRGSGKSALLEAFAFLNEEHLKVDQNGKKKGAVSKLIFSNDNGTRFYQSGWNLVPYFIGFREQLVNTT